MRRRLPIARLGELLASERGLSTAEAEERRRSYGPNEIVETSSAGWRSVIRDTATDPMLWFLVGTGALYSFLEEYAEALVLLAAIVPLIGMDAFLHRRTQASTQGLRSRLAARATVVRDDNAITIVAAELVPGDLVVAAPGEPFPADGIVVAGEGLQVDESALTGESYPVRKQALRSLSLTSGEPAVDACHWGFAGTRLLTGEARLRIAYTGAETIYGEIVQSALSGRHARTPLQRAIARLVTVLVVVASVICLVLAWIRMRQGHGLVDAVLSAVTLAVAALPEEFPVVFTFYLGVGVYRLARRQALVRRAVVVENIGRVSCICSDKTGTITEGRLRLTHCYPAPVLDRERLLAIAAYASRCESGDPLDLAILEAAAPATDLLERLATFPFTEDRGCETAILRSKNGQLVAAVKGVPEKLLSMSSLTPGQHDAWVGLVEKLAASGHKVIACAWRDLEPSARVEEEPDGGFIFAGLLACEDPPREGVAEAVAHCRRAGIRIVMVTGDHPATARAIAREVGLGGRAPKVVRADDFCRQLTAGSEALKGIDVIARALPSQKLALIRALQSQGEIVAVTGDGVNDVPALQAADVGIAMGERGTRSAREVSAIVLLDDNFRTIVQAIGEGRQLFANLRLSFAYLLMIHIPLVLTAALIPFAGFPLLYLPLHIVWLELIIHPTALLVFQGLPGRDWLRAIRKRHRLRFFDAKEWCIIGAVGVLITLIVAGGYERSLGIGRDVGHARAMALAVLTVASAMLTASLSRLQSGTARVTVAITLAISILLIQTPAFATRLHLVPLHLDDWATAMLGGLLAAALPFFAWDRSPRDRSPGD